MEEYKLSKARVGAVAFGAFAVGALAVGALAIGALAIGKLAVGKGEFKTLKIGRLEVDELITDPPRDTSDD